MFSLYPSSATPQKPQLLLCAPKVAGLLPARVPESHANLDFHYTHSELSLLSEEQRQKLYKGAKILLDVALDFMLHEFDESALYAAEVLFHKAAGGLKPKPEYGPVAYRAKINAFRMELMVRLTESERRIMEETESERKKMRSEWEAFKRECDGGEA